MKKKKNKRSKKSRSLRCRMGQIAATTMKLRWFKREIMRNLSRKMLMTKNGQELKICSTKKILEMTKRKRRSSQRWQSKSPKSSILALIPKKKLKPRINCSWSGRFLWTNNKIQVSSNLRAEKSMRHYLKECFHCRCKKLRISQMWTRMD